MGVLGEERLLLFGEAAIGAMSVGVDQLADREAVRLLGRCDFGDGRHGFLSLLGGRSVVGLQTEMLTAWTELHELVGGDREVADPAAGGVEDRVGYGGVDAGGAELADAPAAGRAGGVVGLRGE